MGVSVSFDFYLNEYGGDAAAPCFDVALGCALSAITVDADWELPTLSSSYATFYNCVSLVGGNGTAYSAGRMGGAYMLVGEEGGEATSRPSSRGAASLPGPACCGAFRLPGWGHWYFYAQDTVK